MKKVFRGENHGNVVTTASYKCDWKLVHRDEEHKYLSAVEQPLQRTAVPDSIPFPPLLNYFIMLERQQKGEPLDKPPMLPIKSAIIPKQSIQSET